MIVLDFDGTVVDIATRHHRAYELAVGDLGTGLMAQPAYWRHKRAGRSWPWILERTGVPQNQHDLVLERFVSLIEEPELLALDRVLPGAIGALKALASADDLCLVTARHSYGSFTAQLAALEVNDCFSKVLVAEGADATQAKRALLTLEPVPPRVCIGDTEADITLARSLGARAIAVTSGIRSRAVLRAAKPDHLVLSVVEAAAIVLS